MTVVIRPSNVPQFPVFTRENLEAALVETGLTARFTGNSNSTPAVYLAFAVMGWLNELRKRRHDDGGEWRDLTPEEIAAGMRDIANVLVVVSGRIQSI